MKKKKTIKQQKNRERAIQYSLFAGQFAVLPIPFAAMAIANREEWFINNPEGWKIGLGGGIALALMSIMMFLVSSKKENTELTGGYVALLIGWYAFGFVAFLLSEIMYEIYKIMMISGTGMLAAFGLDTSSKIYKKKADKHKAQLDEAEKQLGVEQAKQEMQEQVAEEDEERVF